MDNLLAERPFRKRRLFSCAVAAVFLEAGFIGLCTIWPSYEGHTRAEQVTSIETDLVPDDAAQLLIAPKEEPIPLPETQPTPPPEDTPPPEETPPPSDDPNLALPAPPLEKQQKPRSARIYPANVPRGDRPQKGVPNGAPHADKTTGNAGAAHAGAVGWHCPAPTYPPQARSSHIVGSGIVRLVTNGSGQVISAVVSRSSGSAILDYNMTGFAKSNWSGPPNATLEKPFTYRFPGD